MSDDPNYKATMLILDDLESNGLIKFNPEFFDEAYFKNFLVFQKAFTNSFGDVVGKLDPFEKGHDNLAMFAIYYESCYVVSHLDVMKIFFKIIIDPLKIKGGFNDDTTLRVLLKKICNKMQYSEKLKNSIHGLFLEDFRNAMTHQNYLIKNTSLVIYPKDANMKANLNLEDLYGYSLQVMAILDAMVDWSNGGPNTPTNNNSTDLDRIVDDFKKQVDLLDKKLEKLS